MMNNMVNLFEKLLGSLHLSLNMFNKKQSVTSSPGAMQAGRDINVQANQNEDIPEIEVWLPGNGAKETFEGYIQNHSGQSLILEYVEVNGVKTEFNQQFRKLIYIRDKQISYPNDVFVKNIGKVKLVTRYRTLSGKIYEHRQTGSQTNGPDKKFNISFNAKQNLPENVHIK